MSHVWALREAERRPTYPYRRRRCDFRDARTERTLEWAITSGALDKFDILYTDIALPLANDTHPTFKSLYDQAVTRDENGNIKSVKFQALDLRDIPFLAASSYLVNKNAIQKLRRLYDDEMAAGIRVPIHLFFRTQAQAGGLKIGCLFPFVTSGEVEETMTSTIRTNPDPTKKFTAANIGRYTFFVGCDWDECDTSIRTHIALPSETDRHAQVLTKLLAFSLMEDGVKNYTNTTYMWPMAKCSSTAPKLPRLSRRLSQLVSIARIPRYAGRL